MKPIIGITLDYDERKTVVGGYSDHPWYALRVNYAQAVAAAGGVVVMLPYIAGDIDAYVKLCDGFLIPGGEYDIDPAYYGEEVDPNTNLSTDFRVEFESKLLKEAMAARKPILGICAGEQLLNVICGGTLFQHIPSQIPGALEHKHNGGQDILWHEVNIVPGTLLSSIVQVPQYKINSHHHQSVRKLANDFIVNATAFDGVIEGIEHTSLPFCLGVEWHPEYGQSEGDKRIIQALIHACRKTN